MAAGGDARRPVHVDSDIALLAQVRRPRMDAHAHPNRSRAQSFECFGGRPQSAGGSRERDEEGIPLRIDLDTLIGRERLTNNAAMLRQHPRVLLGAQFMQQPGRTHDVGKEEGDGARRQNTHLGEGLRSLRPNASNSSRVNTAYPERDSTCSRARAGNGLEARGRFVR